jgi:hypothetical protein
VQEWLKGHSKTFYCDVNWKYLDLASRPNCKNEIAPTTKW